MNDLPETPSLSCRPLPSSQPSPGPVAFGAHRFGRWGHISHTEEDVTAWIDSSNALISDQNHRWHGPVPLFDDIEALADEVELKQACIAGMQGQMSKLASRLEHCQQWYAARFERLGNLARTLPEPTQTQLFNIMANGSADWMEPPSYTGMLTLYENQRNEFEQRADNLGAMLGRMVHATRHAEDSKIIEVRNAAITLIRKLGAASPLRTQENLQIPQQQSQDLCA